MGGRGSRMKAGGGDRALEPIDVQNTKLTKKQIGNIGVRRWEMWSAARQNMKSTKPMREPELTAKQTRIWEEVKEGDYSSFDKASSKTVRALYQKSMADYYDTLSRVAKSDYGPERDYYTWNGKRLLNSDGFTQVYKDYKAADKISNTIYSKMVDRGMINQ